MNVRRAIELLTVAGAALIGSAAGSYLHGESVGFFLSALVGVCLAGTWVAFMFIAEWLLCRRERRGENYGSRRIQPPRR